MKKAIPYDSFVLWWLKEFQLSSTLQVILG